MHTYLSYGYKCRGALCMSHSQLGQLSLASLWGRLIEHQLRLG